nr:hypothetical protein [Cognatishimia sp. MH4019]
MRSAAALALTAPLAACATTGASTVQDPAPLADALAALDPTVSRAEANRAAALAFRLAAQLARDYQVTDPPLIHNSKVHAGLRDRGLCNHFAEDMLARLRQESFQTLKLHWATSPSTPLRIVHHAPAISSANGTFRDSIILDAWRNSGRLFWAPVSEDTRYNWMSLQEAQPVLRARRDRTAAS